MFSRHLTVVDAKGCSVGTADGPRTSAACADVESGDRVRVIDCALLHYVRRSEVRGYVRRVEEDGPVECDDSTPLEELGVP
jgi:hypothetical protein